MGDYSEYYRESFDRNLRVKIPEKVDDQLTLASALIEKRREVAEVDQALAAQKEEFRLKMESLQQRRDELSKKEFLLKTSLIKFDRFLKDNDAKKFRALKRITEERDAIHQRENEIDHLRDELTALQHKCSRVQMRLHRYQAAHQFLERCVESNNEFHEVRDLIMRNDTLVANHQALTESDIQNQQLIKDQKQVLKKYVEDKTNEKLSYTNQLASLQTQLDRCEEHVSRLEGQLSLIRSGATSKLVLLGQSRMATYNLYQQVVEMQKKQRRNKTQDDPIAAMAFNLDADKTVEQLAVIMAFLHDLEAVLIEARRRLITQLGMQGTGAETPSDSPTKSRESRSRSRAASAAGGPVVRLQSPSTNSKAVPSPARATATTQHMLESTKPTPRKK